MTASVLLAANSGYLVSGELFVVLSIKLLTLSARGSFYTSGSDVCSRRY